MSIEAFVQLRLREAESPVLEVQQMVSALEMIAGADRDVDGCCTGCDRRWPCTTIRYVAWTWRRRRTMTPHSGAGGNEHGELAY